MRTVNAGWVLGVCLAVGGGSFAQDGAMRADGSSSNVIVVSAPNPSYTDEARAKKISGNVVVHVTVGTDGLPRDVRVVRGIGYGLDEKAVEAVKQYRFKPATRDGQPVETALNIEVNFQIF